ncbi:ferrochelatase [Paenibacillus apiarius]|uniref:Ferrochelatase n=1 Tax=Paenibacillus apiarius TaxID=46240 RepID=A0ABT4E1H4_9BACL|nr:ferrochelatase [Paenibacillus apiarius]MCY9512890.1 ferrochelatase [Paenibacillus apiarius]MCY9522061.1 ferrochelatase [Paenibacillus apiarius]MCY9554120.1 ferrochelatase [Paenibacillus apiarius]MCY9558821.1 ferrochelatase [Paenibacillus apiarius]MCY9683868.1 ferrochelatase [Paenibacillus apiarius]
MNEHFPRPRQMDPSPQPPMEQRAAMTGTEQPQQAVLLTAYGASSSIDDVQALYEHILYGHRPSADTVIKGVERYRRTGVCDPLYAVTKRQAEAISQISGMKCGTMIPVYIGCKHSKPFVSDAVRQAAHDGITQLAILHLTPFSTPTGTGMYVREAKKAIAAAGASLQISVVSDWQEHPAFIKLMARRLRDAYQWLPSASLATARVIFTVHSKPGLPTAHQAFIAQYCRLSRLIAEQAEIGRWDMAYRSGMPAPQRWLGPDIKDVIQQAAAEGCQAVVVCELTSMTDNIEVYHDLGEEAKQVAEQCGMQFVRTEYANDAYDFMGFMADIVAAHWLRGDYCSQ